jgi:hypothetical protein
MDAASWRVKVLISAYACGPKLGSEPGAGWTWTRAAAERHEVWVMTREKFAAAIAEACRDEPALRVHAVHLDLPSWVQRWKRREGGSHWYYLLWQLQARRVARRLHCTVGFDVAHHLTFAVDWMPVAVANLPGVPFVWGPVGGATGTPISMWGWLREQLERHGYLATRSMRWGVHRSRADRWEIPCLPVTAPTMRQGWITTAVATGRLPAAGMRALRAGKALLPARLKQVFRRAAGRVR